MAGRSWECDVADDPTCAVCGETAEERLLSSCSNCGEVFHLNPRNDVPGKDCGSVWINDNHLALEFACQRCLDGGAASEAAPASQPRILRPRVGRRRYRKKE
jgi:hypothetical protein